MNGDRATRRRVLQTGAVALGGGSLLRTAGDVSAASERQNGPTVTAATWNLGLGADFLSIARAETDASVPERVGTLYEQVTDSRPQARMDAVAASLSETRPDIVGVQEAALVRRDPRTDGAIDDPDAETVVVDLLASLRAALEERNVPYRPVSIATNADLEFPGQVDGEPVDVRLTDRDVLLIRADAEISVAETATGAYDTSLTLPIDRTQSVEVSRGYAAATFRASGDSMSVVTTHLEAALDDIRAAQAAELASIVASRPSPAILLGDLNSGPADGNDRTPRDGESTAGSETGTPVETSTRSQTAYGRLTAELTDPIDPEAWAESTGQGTGTCCRPESLQPPDSDGLPQRIDHVLVDGFRATESRRLGTEPASLGGEAEVWASDHAGVFAELVPESETATATAVDTTASETVSTAPGAPTTVSTTATQTPGFGVVAALAAFGVAVRAALRGRRRP